MIQPCRHVGGDDEQLMSFCEFEYGADEPTG